MLNDFLISIGLRRSHVEVWNCQQLVIVDAEGQIIWCRPGVIKYTPLTEQYWGGKAGIYDVRADAPTFHFFLDGEDTNDGNSFLIPYVSLASGHPGGKINGRDEAGEIVTLYAGQHALNFIAARALVDASEQAAVEVEEDDE